MDRFGVEGAQFETGLGLVEDNRPVTADLAARLTRPAREAYEPGMRVEVWGGRMAS